MGESDLDGIFAIPRLQMTPPKITFFDLPFNVRYRVYKIVGLIRTCPIDLNPRHIFPTAQCYFRKCSYRCNCQPLPWGLFLVSPEVSRIFYSRNRFKICQSAPGGLRALQNLRPASLSALTMLSIRINLHPSENCFDGIHEPFGGLFRQLWPDEPSRRGVSSKLGDWISVCKRMAEHIQPGRLRLSFICDTNDFETGNAFLNPLKTVRTLSECSIRLSQELYPQLQRLAKEAVEELTRPTSMKFPFHLLPAELQILVLTHTDLVAPCAIEWIHGRGYRCRKGTQILKRCTICADVREICCSEIPSSSDTRCKTCWKFPSGLFQASRTIREDALRIFYSRNHFVISLASASLRTNNFKPVQFISHIPRHIRKYVKSLQFSLPYDDEHLDPTIQHHHEIATILLNMPDMEFSKLTLTIEINARTFLFPLFSSPSLDEKRMASYHAILPKFFNGLQGRLKDVFVHLPFRLWDGDSPRIRAEKSLERSIMGDKGYDSIARGKFKRPRTWEVAGDYDGTEELVDENGFRSVDDAQLGISSNLYPWG